MATLKKAIKNTMSLLIPSDFKKIKSGKMSFEQFSATIDKRKKRRGLM